MAMQRPHLRQDATGVVPSLLLWLAFVLAAVGVVAHAAFL